MDVARISQLPGHCGPTTVAMLASYAGVPLRQEEIVRHAGLDESIHENGSRLDELRMALRKLTSLDLLVRYGCDPMVIGEILSIDIPVGVEWQGGFRDGSGGYFDVGHFSVVVELGNDSVKMVDPDDEAYFSEGVVPLAEFLSRWWECNDFDDADSPLRSSGCAFCVVHPTDDRYDLLVRLGFQPSTYEVVRTASS